jgi:hypothetical protein
VLTLLAAAVPVQSRSSDATSASTGGGAQVGYAASRSVLDDYLTAITVVSTAGHARPGVLLEIEAVANIPG